MDRDRWDLNLRSSFNSSGAVNKDPSLPLHTENNLLVEECGDMKASRSDVVTKDKKSRGSRHEKGRKRRSHENSIHDWWDNILKLKEQALIQGYNSFGQESPSL